MLHDDGAPGKSTLLRMVAGLEETTEGQIHIGTRDVFIGSPAMNFMRGKVTGQGIEVPGLGRTVRPGVTLPPSGTDVIVGLRPEHAALSPDDAGLSVELTDAQGGVSYTYLTAPTGEKLVIEKRGDDRSRAGDRVRLDFDDTRVFVFDRTSEARIR